MARNTHQNDGASLPPPSSTTELELNIADLNINRENMFLDDPEDSYITTNNISEIGSNWINLAFPVYYASRHVWRRNLVDANQVSLHQQRDFITMARLRNRINLGQNIIFVRTKASARMLHQQLDGDGYSVTTIHGFRNGLTQVLISTDLLARGFDQQQVNLVVNYDLPVKHEASCRARETPEPD